MFVSSSFFATDNTQIINRRAQADLRSDSRRTRFKLIWQIRIDCFLESDALDHIAAALKRIHLFQQRRFAVDDAAACGRKNLMTRESVEITIQILYIDACMRRPLRAIN